MATAIETLLQRIKTAVYGRDVRDAIHDSIKQCYADATGNPASVAKLTNDLATVSAKVTALENQINAMGDYHVVRKYELLHNINQTIKKGTVITLADDIINYQQLEVQFYYKGWCDNQMIETTGQGTAYNIVRRVDYAPQSINGGEFVMRFSGNTLTFEDAKYLTWNTSTKDFALNDIVDATNDIRISRVVGVKYFKVNTFK